MLMCGAFTKTRSVRDGYMSPSCCNSLITATNSAADIRCVKWPVYCSVKFELIVEQTLYEH